MSLRSIHLVFITASIALSLLITVWGVEMFVSGSGARGHLAFAGTGLAAAIGLAIYLIAFVRKTRRLGIK